MNITFALELPPTEIDDEVALQTLKCTDCGFRGIAVYRESRRGRLDSQSWHHEGYPITDAALEKLYQEFLLCPSPRDRSCGCATHRRLSQQSWMYPVWPGVDSQARFSMRLVV
jgi:hypothetical protein